MRYNPAPALTSIIRLSCLLVLSILPHVSRAESIHIAAASNFTGAMKALVAEFEQASGHKVHVSFGSSGKFYAQIMHGAPFQIFFSADQAKPKALEKSGLSVSGTRFTYAIGALALWSSKPGFIDSEGRRLRNGNFNKLALANPKLAPYGIAAIEVLESLKLKQNTRSKWVQGENIAQTYQFISTGNADLGFISLAQIRQKNQSTPGSVWIIPTTLHEPIRQDAVLLKRGEKNRAAQELLKFIRSEQAQTIIKSHGYQIPSAKI
ncbi:MAG: molybdate ABC transporter substrate-binding protein [Alteromonadaceae bacterium]|nr:MAG: molybdate ABC transporter substrate-binding protein [Alteromonadaceae bacterium]